MCLVTVVRMLSFDYYVLDTLFLIESSDGFSGALSAYVHFPILVFQRLLDSGSPSLMIAFQETLLWFALFDYISYIYLFLVTIQIDYTRECKNIDNTKKGSVVEENSAKPTKHLWRRNQIAKLFNKI